MSGQPCCDACGACAGDCRCAGACAEATVLAAPANRPGLGTLAVRLGNHGGFLAAAMRALSAPDAPALRLLGTRAASDPAIAWLDAWAVAADVLTFYRERLTQEGYLRTATEDRSLRELASEIGYKPRPGIAASVRLAYLLDPTAAPVEIPVGAKAQTVPQPGEQMQTFETSEPLQARAEWSEMAPRQTRIPAIDRLNALFRKEVTLNDSTLNVRPGERVLFLYGLGLGQQVVREVAEAKIDIKTGSVRLKLVAKSGLTIDIARFLLKTIDRLRAEVARPPVDPGLALVTCGVASYLLGGSAADARDLVKRADDPAFKEIVDAFVAILRAKPVLEGGIEAQGIDALLGPLAVGAAVQLRSNSLLPRAASAGLDSEGAKRGELLSIASPQVGRNLYAAWQSLPAVSANLDNAPQTMLLRVTAGAFGAVAPKVVTKVVGGKVTLEEPLLESVDSRYAFLDSLVEGIAPDSFALVDSPFVSGRTERMLRLARVRNAQPSPRNGYQISGKVTRLELVDPMTNEDVIVPVGKGVDLSFLRNTLYSIQSQRVSVAGDAIDVDVQGQTIDLDRLYDGLTSGRWIIVAGERTDILVNGVPLPGVMDSELAMLSGVDQTADSKSPGDTPRSVLKLATPLAYRYKRATAKIYGNVVRATHGETVTEVIGSGDAKVPFARFAPRRAPLTFVPAPTTSGVRGSQDLRANGMKLREVESLLDAGASDRAYELSVDGAGAASVTFGDGMHGARVPTGQENLRAIYRVGIGSPGNVKAEQISLLTSRPLGVRGVINPLPASGGADRDGPERIRTSAPLAALALSPLSRLVSVSDHEYFARRFAGIGDARAQKLADGGYGCVHVTLAGVDDIPLKRDDDLITSLRAAYDDFGDPALPVVLGIRELVALFLQAKVALRPDADEDVVVPEIRRRLLDVFSSSRRRLAQSAYLSELVAVIQSVRGVDWVDVDVFGGITELQLRNPAALALAVAELQKQAAGGPVATAVYCAEAMRSADAPPERVALIPLVDGRRPRILPAQLAFLVPSVPDTLVLNLVQGHRS